MRLATTADAQAGDSLSISLVSGILNLLDTPLLVCDRTGRILMINQQAKLCLDGPLVADGPSPNMFHDLLRMDPKVIVGQMDSGEHEIDLQMTLPAGKVRARIQCIPELDWLMVQLEPAGDAQSEDDVSGSERSSVRPTVQALLQEREITYRNLLAAYLRLQEVNRQKTVFLASAAHELKTPLAVIKGYYDLLLSGSLGKLNDKQRDILQESKESCERLVRLVSMFLNYSTLESGKLVLHMRENDLRDCLLELATRWNEAFQRKHVRLEICVEEKLPVFKFDYQKVQQAVANLMDNALKHTPAGGSVVLRAEAYFWERRNAKEAAATSERRRTQQPTQQPGGNAVRVAVSDTGPGIASEHHQEIFEDFVRVDRTSSGMGLGLAIAKRLVQAHRGKIWVESEPRRGSTFTFLLPTDNPQNAFRGEA